MDKNYHLRLKQGTPSEDKFFTTDEVVKYLRIPKSTIYKLSQKGKIPSSKIGKQLRFRKSSIDKWLTQRESKFSTQTPQPILTEKPHQLTQQTLKAVLLIDDDELVLKTLTRFLKLYGYNVETAQTGEEALKKIEEFDFDLVIVDIRMPGIDGIETIKRIRELSHKHNRPSVPEIIITGYMDSETERQAQNLGISDYLYKPFLTTEFINTVRKKLEALS